MSNYLLCDTCTRSCKQGKIIAYDGINPRKLCELYVNKIEKSWQTWTDSEAAERRAAIDSDMWCRVGRHNER